MSSPADSPWRSIEACPPINGNLAEVLASVDTLRSAWVSAISRTSEGEFAEARRRSLRRHAIETGIIERLYNVDWGVTEALVAEGLTAEVAAREGDLDDDALAIIRDQYDALEFLASAARAGRDLTVHFVRELHQAICRSQRTYEARNALGQIVQVPLLHGQWKNQPNHVRRPDGSVLEYTPPEHVQAEMELLVTLYAESVDTHPVVLAAWLHHRFISIHPFQDGNGRVARALTLLVLLKADYAPLVVGRTIRTRYISSLDKANGGDLRDLVRLFAELELVALRSELERPAEIQPEGAGAIEVARSYAARLRTLRASAETERSQAAEALADAAQLRIFTYLENLGRGVRDQFQEFDPDARSGMDRAAPPDSRAAFWASQIIRTAREVDFFTNISSGTWWTRLHLTVLEHTLRYGVVVQKVGHGESGVLAVTAFAEILPPRASGEEERPHIAALRSSQTDSVTLVHGDDIDVKWRLHRGIRRPHTRRRGRKLRPAAWLDDGRSCRPQTSLVRI